MAPAGNFTSLQAAIQGGANSVYFGVEQLNMRAKSSNNFTVDDLMEVRRITAQAGVKAYLTLNIVLYDHDLPAMRKLMDSAKKADLDAVIVSDQAALQYAVVIGLPVHLSTQLNISNSEAVRFYSQFADVMVLARELSLDQVKQIHQVISEEQITGPSGRLVRLEMFAHGALCMAVSGKCYLSLHQYNASANRGACLQACRRAYTVTEKSTGDQLEVDNEYIMSPKDLCTVDFLDTLLDTGTSVLKIEGRARSPEYVKTVTRCYREAADAVLGGTYTQDKVENWIEQLKSVYNRGFWDGYYRGRKLGEWSGKYGSQAARRKMYLGKSSNYFKQIGVAEFQLEAEELETGDDILIMGPTTGVIELKVDELRVDGNIAKKAHKGDLITLPVPRRVRGADKLYRWVARKSQRPTLA